MKTAAKKASSTKASSPKASSTKAASKKAVVQASVNGIDEYIGTLPEERRPLLEKIRQTIRKAIPKAEERISYRIPAFTLEGKDVVYFAAWKSHLSVYPIPQGDESFEAKIAPYRAAKGTLRFDYEDKIPLTLIAQLAKLRVKEMRPAR